MDTDDSQNQPQPNPQQDTLADRVVMLENKVERLENEMKAIAKMKKAIDQIFGNDNPNEAE